MILDTKVEVLQGTAIKTNTIIHNTHTVLHLEIDSVMTKLPFLHNIHVQELTTIRETQDLIFLLIDLPIDHLTDVTLVLDTDHARIPETKTIVHNIHLPFDHPQDREILNVIDLAQIQTQEMKLIQYNHILKLTQLPLKYICVTQLK